MPRSKPDMLTETKVRNAKPSPGTKAKPDPRPKKYFDGDGRGLYLLVNPNGSKLWRYKFRMHGKERLVSLGRYPDIGLADARRARDERRKLVANGVDPVALKREKHEERREELRATFGEAAERYFKRKAHGWSITHRRDVRRMLDKELLPALAKLPIPQIKSTHVRDVIDRIAERRAITYAHDVRLYFRAILHDFNAERAEHRRVADPSHYVQIPDRAEETPHAALQPQEIGPFLHKLTHSDATPLVRIAVRMLLLTAVRTKELRFARWSDIDEKAKLWRVPRENMKAKREHVVPLAPPVLALLRDLRMLSGEHTLLFPSLTDPEQPISENTILAAIYRMGYKGRMTGHGARAVFSTWAHENEFLSDAIERQLAHTPRDKVKSAYLRSQFMGERVKMMTAWAEFLDDAERNVNAAVVPIGSKRVA